MTTVLGIGKLPANVITQYPSGRWGFVGGVDARLAYVTLAGETPTDDQLWAVRLCGPRMAGLKSRSFATEADARAALASLKTES